MFENPIIAIILILGGTFQFYSVSAWNDDTLGDITSLRGYTSSFFISYSGIVHSVKNLFLNYCDYPYDLFNSCFDNWHFIEKDRK
jgi:hypothetical protein